MSLFDDFESEDDIKVNDKPLWTMDLDDPDNEKQILKWLTTDLDAIREMERDRVEQARRHLAIYRNQPFSPKVGFSKAEQEFVRTGKSQASPRMSVNHIFDLVEQKVSRLTKFKPAVAVVPNNDEFEDRVAARMNEAFWMHIREAQRLDEKIRQGIRSAKISGDAFLFITWDPDKGPEHPESKSLRSKGQPKLTLLDEHGDPQQDEQGNRITIDLPVKVGDVAFDIAHGWEVWLEQTTDFDLVNYCYWQRRRSIEALRLQFPKKAQDIKATSEERFFDQNRFQEIQLKSDVVVNRFYHRHTREMPRGREIWFTRDAILVNRDLSFDHGRLPMARIVDIDLPESNRGQSFIVNVRQLVSRINDLTTMIVRNQALVSHPKWFAPKGSCKAEALGNDSTIVWYRGPQPPVLGQANPTPAEVFNFRRELVQDVQQVSGVFGVSRGEPPKGIKAGIALQFLEEQENERNNAEVAHYNQLVVDVARLALDVAAQHYDKSDGRTIRILGANNEWMAQEFDPANLTKPFSIRIQNTSALPESKAGRIQTLLDLREGFPGMFTDEVALDLIDLGMPQKFIDAATAAVKSAEFENEQILMGKKVHDPEEYEFHVEHWQIHVRALQEVQFHIHASPKIREKMKDHVRAHEMFMTELALVNPAFAQRLSQLKQFPLLFTPTPLPPPAPVQAGQSPQTLATLAATGQPQAQDLAALEPQGEMRTGV